MTTAHTDFARQLRADGLHRILERRRDARTVEAVHRISDVWSWPRPLIDEAIGDLVHDGLLTEDAHGRLVVHRSRAA